MTRLTISQIFLAAGCLALFAASAVAQPIVFPGGVIDGAQFEPGRAVAPGSLISIFGSGLSPDLQQGDTVPLSSNIDGVTVMIGGIVTPMYFVSPGQINAQLPWDLLPSGTNSMNASIVVKSGGLTSAVQTIPVATFAPGVFAATTPTGRYGIVINLDGTLAAPNGSVPGLTTHPAKPGDVVIMYANGLGPIDSSLATGAAGGDILRRTTTQPEVLIGGQSAQLQFSGLTPNYPGVNQLNYVIPQVPPGDKVSVQVRIGGLISTDQVFMAVGQ